MRAALSIFLVSTLVLACGGGSTGPNPPPPPPPPPPPSPVATVTVTPGTPSIVEGTTVQLTATVRDAQGNELTGRTVAWASVTTSVATVSGTGLVTGVAAGTSEVRATSEGQSGSATVIVTRVPVATVTVSTLPTLDMGTTGQLTVTLKDAQGNTLPAAGRTITWSSGSDAIATVNATGLVTAVAVGSTEVTATSEGKSGATTVTVVEGAVATITLAPPLTLEVGASGQLVATLKTAQGVEVTGRTILWTSLHPAIATVSQSGEVLGVAAGQATIKAESEGKNAEIAVTVLAPAAPVKLADISVGGSHACGLDAAGGAWCWGENGNGELGDGTFTQRNNPVPVSGSHVFTSIHAGGIHTCALKASGQAWCWGDNLYGSLGDGTFIDKQTPVQVAGGQVFASMTTGAFHTCARTAAGVAWCWGYGDNGAIGDNGAFHRNAPVQVQGGLTFTQLSAGYYHTCGVVTGGAAYCWGDNGAQDLPGITTGPGILGTGSAAGLIAQPALVTGGLQFTQLAAGMGFTCGVTNTQALSCWGVNTHGNLGDASNTLRTAPAAVAVAGTFAAITTGAFHACARSSANEAWCWGRNSLGQLGDGTNVARNAPVKTVGSTGYIKLSANASTSCAIATNNDAWCWGNGGGGAIGDGTTESRNAPVRVKP